MVGEAVGGGGGGWQPGRVGGGGKRWRNQEGRGSGPWWEAGGRRGGEVAADHGRCWRPAAVEVAQQKEMEGLGEGEEARRGWEEGGKARR